MYPACNVHAYECMTPLTFYPSSDMYAPNSPFHQLTSAYIIIKHNNDVVRVPCSPAGTLPANPPVLAVEATIQGPTGEESVSCGTEGSSREYRFI